MVITVNGTDIFYKRHLGDKTVILLHGWGGTHALMDGVFDALALCGLDIISVDLPGFGNSPVPPPTFSTPDYAECISLMIKQLGLKDVTLIGHSFGGRLAIILGSDPNVSALVLTAAAGLKPRFSFKKKLAIMRFKMAKRMGKDVSKYGSTDYKALNGVLRQIFVRVVNHHLDEHLPKINVPTLLVWGKSDTETPLYMAKKIKKKVKDCGLIVLDGGHFAYLQNNRIFVEIIKSFVLG